MGVFYSSSTDTDVFAQLVPLVTGDVSDPVTLAVYIEIQGGNFESSFLEGTLPAAFSTIIKRIVDRLEDKNGNPRPDYHPFGLPTLTLDVDIINYVPRPAIKTFPLFWLRNQNIDITSAWWNIFTETGAAYNNIKTNFNDEYWLRDINDPDIDRVPGDNFTLLSNRTNLVTDLGFPTPQVQNAVPYELVHPEWFKLHPEYIKTDKILKSIGVDIALDLIPKFRESESNNDIDHVMLGFFQGVLPRKKEEARYLYKFFKSMFKDSAFRTPLTKKTSPCVANAINEDGFFTHEGRSRPFINQEGNTLAQLKNNNYYYEYQAFPYDPNESLTENSVFFFNEPRGEMNYDFRAENIFIRKVKGIIGNGRKGTMEVLVGKGAWFPEFTNFGEPIYPVDPSLAPNSATYVLNRPALESFEGLVTVHHGIYMRPHINPDDVNRTILPNSYVSIKVQKNGNFSSTHPWDMETATGITGQYYEEIIILNPRSVFKGIYKEGSKSHHASRAFHAGEAGDFWTTSDNPVMKIFRTVTSTPGFPNPRYEDITWGTRFDGESEKSDAISIPMVNSIARSMSAKQREVVMVRSMSVLTLAIVRTRTSAFDKFISDFIEVVGVALFILTGNIQFASLKAFLISVAKEYVRFKVVEFAANELAKFLVKEFGFKLGSQIAAVITIVATGKIVGNLNAGEDIGILLSMAANVDDAFMELTRAEIASNVLLLEEREKENKRRIQDLNEDAEDLLGTGDPNLTRLNSVYLVENETPSEFFARTIGNLNPGVLVYPMLQTQIARSKIITYDQTPLLMTEEMTDDEYLENLV